MTKFTIFCFCALSLLSCADDFTDIVPSTAVLEEEIFTDIQRAREFLNPAYGDVQNRPNLNLEGFTNNLTAINANRGATSGYSAENSPVNGQWVLAYRQIFHINEFLQKGFEVPFDAFDIETSNALQKRIRGEAFGLRAYYKWILLKNFSGPSAEGGEMLGFPIVDDLISIEEANNLPRSTFEECYSSILGDIQLAYENIEILRYAGTDQNPISGVQLTSRVSREALLALRARIALFAASPAYEKIPWAEAADIIYNAIVEIEQGETLIDLQPFGDFNRTDNPDHFWRVGYVSSSALEQENYPPSMFGNGVFSPTQNIVDIFSDANGFPIGNTGSTYDPENPYDGRDPRLNTFIFTNDSTDYQSDLPPIETFIGGRDASGGILSNATRTGYYLKKFLSSVVNLNPDRRVAGESATDLKIFPVFSRGDLYLDFAEAALEAYPSDGQGSFMFSSEDAVRKIRERGGISADEDNYMVAAVGDAATFKNLIRNERRIENAFEGEYFYDVRRWMLPLESLQQPIRGMQIVNDNGNFTYDPDLIVEPRVFENNYYYNPIPRSEVLTSSAIIQNAGW